MPKYLYYERGDRTPAGRSSLVTLVEHKIEDQPRIWRFLGSQTALVTAMRRDLARRIHTTGVLYEKPLARHVSQGIKIDGWLMQDFISRLSPHEWRRLYRGL